MTIDQDLLNRIVELAREFGATRLLLFGSALDTPAAPRDIDLACDGVDGWALYKLAAKIEEAIGFPVHLFSLSPPSRITEVIERRGRRLI